MTAFEFILELLGGFKDTMPLDRKPAERKTLVTESFRDAQSCFCIRDVNKNCHERQNTSHIEGFQSRGLCVPKAFRREGFPFRGLYVQGHCVTIRLADAFW